MADYATPADIVAAWRPLTAIETGRAEYWIGAATRKLRRRWKDLDPRVNEGTLDVDDVKDVIVDLVITVLPQLDKNGVKSWSASAGAEAQSQTMESGSADERLELKDWMIEIFEGSGTSTPKPKIAAPKPYDLNKVFPSWKETY